jgi:hypothetical protein
MTVTMSEQVKRIFLIEFFNHSWYRPSHQRYINRLMCEQNSPMICHVLKAINKQVLPVYIYVSQTYPQSLVETELHQVDSVELATMTQHSKLSPPQFC